MTRLTRARQAMRHLMEGGLKRRNGESAMSSCIDFRRSKLTAPGASCLQRPLHTLATCARCANFAREVMNWISVWSRRPSRGTGRTRRAHSVAGASCGGDGGRDWHAIAAGILISAAAALLLTQELPATEPGATHDRACRERARSIGPEQDVPGDQVMQAFRHRRRTIFGNPGRVSFLGHCRGLDLGGTHLVVDTPYGRAAVLLLPNGNAWRKTTVSESGRCQSPAGAAGIVQSLRVLAQASQIERVLSHAVDWNGSTQLRHGRSWNGVRRTGSRSQVGAHLVGTEAMSVNHIS
ncbi:MAG: hypothetical protein MZW92_68275 [Comamonadaceae bacterium]|nr:hypothetical protein [Comamonadaceae bacterium]